MSRYLNEKPCFVYAIATVRNGKLSTPVKVGISATPHARMAELQTGSALPLVLVGMLMAPDREVARQTEKFIHFCHPDRKMQGEWLSISPWYAVGMIGEFIAEKIAENFGSEPRAIDDFMRSDVEVFQ